MTKLINLLNQKERRLILYAGLFLFLIVLFYFFIVKVQIKAQSINQETLSSKKNELMRLSDSLIENKKEYMKWIDAEHDIAYVKNLYFYHGMRSLHSIRRDLDDLFQKTGFIATDLQYDYKGKEEENNNKISISFDITGTYDRIKKFLFEIEILEKFLYIEKITFKDIERKSGKLRLGLSLAVYYEK